MLFFPKKKGEGMRGKHARCFEGICFRSWNWMHFTHNEIKLTILPRHQAGAHGCQSYFQGTMNADVEWDRAGTVDTMYEGIKDPTTQTTIHKTITCHLDSAEAQWEENREQKSSISAVLPSFLWKLSKSALCPAEILTCINVAQWVCGRQISNNTINSIQINNM